MPCSPSIKANIIKDKVSANLITIQKLRSYPTIEFDQKLDLLWREYIGEFFSS